jgi:hypothetical protein
MRVLLEMKNGAKVLLWLEEYPRSGGGVAKIVIVVVATPRPVGTPLARGELDRNKNEVTGEKI